VTVPLRQLQRTHVSQRVTFLRWSNVTCAIVKVFKCKVIEWEKKIKKKNKKRATNKLIGTQIHLREEHVKSHFVLVCFPVIVLTPAWSRSSEPAVLNPPPSLINITFTKDTRKKTGRVECRHLVKMNTGRRESYDDLVLCVC